MSRPVVRSESSIEAGCCKIARTQGVRNIKLQGGEVGMPDRAFLLGAGKVWLVEFKAATGRLSKRQEYLFANLEAAGYPVAVIRDTETFRLMLGRLTTVA